MAQFLPYILPLILGRTFDLHNMRVGVDIFPKETIDNKQIYKMDYSRSYYGLVESARDARDLLDHAGDAFSLRVKAGIVNAGATGAYLTDIVDRRNTAEMMLKVTYGSSIEYLPFDAKPIPNWEKHGESLGTHYVRTITYGGEIIVSIRFKTNSTKIKEMIKAPVSNRVLDYGTKGEDEYIRGILKSVEATEIKIFSTVPFTNFPKDIESLGKLSDLTEGKTVPIKVQLSPLEELDSTRDDKLKNRLSRVRLEDFEIKFDDMLETKREISHWLKNLVKPLTDEQEQKVGDFYNNLEKTLTVFYEVIGTLDTSKGPEQLKKAYDALDNELEKGYFGYFYKKYLRLREEIDKDQGEEVKKAT